jgi:hypothetical protein
VTARPSGWRGVEGIQPAGGGGERGGGFPSGLVCGVVGGECDGVVGVTREEGDSVASGEKVLGDGPIVGGAGLWDLAGEFEIADGAVDAVEGGQRFASRRWRRSPQCRRGRRSGGRRRHGPIRFPGREGLGRRARMGCP